MTPDHLRPAIGVLWGVLLGACAWLVAILVALTLFR